MARETFIDELAEDLGAKLREGVKKICVRTMAEKGCEIREEVSSEELNRRFMYHVPNDTKARKHERVRAGAKDLALRIQAVVPECREKEIAMEKVEEALFWANAGIARRN